VILGAADENRPRAEERRDEERLRALVQAVRRADLEQPPAVDDADPGSELEGLFLVVRDEDRRYAERLLDLLQALPQLPAYLDVEGAERLVEQQHVRPVGEGPREGDTLPLAAGELVLVAATQAAQADEIQELLAALAALGGRNSPDAQPELDVLFDGHVPKDRVVLEDEADIAALRRKKRHVVAGQPDRPFVGQREARDHAQDRALAAAGSTEQNEELSRLDLEGHAVDGHLRRVALRDVLQRDGHQVSLFPAYRTRKKKIKNERAARTAATALAVARLPASNWAKM
jgi:hypothetical protein